MPEKIFQIKSYFKEAFYIMGRGMKFPAMGGLGNMQGMLQKVQKMQGEMQKMQEELQARTFEATAGGGAVNGRYERQKGTEPA
jgi:hypothetical protein